MIRRLSSLPLLALATLALASCSATPNASAPIQGGDRYGPVEGESEFTFAGNLTNQMLSADVGGDVDTNTIFLQFGGGYFLDDNQEIGGTVNLINSETKAGGSTFDAQNLGLYPYYRWNFRSEAPGWFYAGGQLGLSVIDSGFGGTDTTVGFGVHGGYKHWLRSNMAVFIEPRLNFVSLDSGDLIDFTTLLGLAVTL